jgi:hypothetical protein
LKVARAEPLPRDKAGNEMGGGQKDEQKTKKPHNSTESIKGNKIIWLRGIPNSE